MNNLTVACEVGSNFNAVNQTTESKKLTRKKGWLKEACERAWAEEMQLIPVFNAPDGQVIYIDPYVQHEVEEFYRFHGVPSQESLTNEDVLHLILELELEEFTKSTVAKYFYD